MSAGRLTAAPPAVAGVLVLLVVPAGCTDGADDGPRGAAATSSPPSSPSSPSGSPSTPTAPAATVPLPPGASGWTVRDEDGCDGLAALTARRLVVRVPEITAACLRFPSEGQQLVVAAPRSALPPLGDPVPVPGVEARVVPVTPPELSRGQVFLVEAGTAAYLVPWSGGTGGGPEDLVARLFG